MLPFAAHSRTALAMVSQLSQEMGNPATRNLKTLAAQFGITGKAAQNMATTGMEQAMARMANLNTVARNLSASISGQLDSAMASAIVKASGLDAAYQKWATAVMNKAPTATLNADLAGVHKALDSVTTVEQKATKMMNDGKTAAVGYGESLKGAATASNDLGSAAKKAGDALALHASSAKIAAVSAQGFGQQAHTAAGSASGLASQASTATTQVRNLGTASGVTRGSLGTVNNEIRTTGSGRWRLRWAAGLHDRQHPGRGVGCVHGSRAGARPRLRHRQPPVQVDHGHHQRGHRHLHHPPRHGRPGVPRCSHGGR